MKSSKIKTIGLVAIIFFTFGITFLDFENPAFEKNIRPYAMLMLGIATMIFWLVIKKKQKSQA